MKQKRYFRTFTKFNSILVLAALLHTACTEDLSSGMTESPITFTIDGNSFEASGITRGAQVGSISNFGVSASVYDKDAVGGYTSAGCGSYFYNQSATNGTPMNYYWPTAKYKMSFYAYYPYGSSDFILQSSANSNGSPTYSYTVPETIASQIDIMTAERTDVSCTSHPIVELSFAHRLSDIRFSCENVGAESVILKSISICGVKYAGTLTGSTWTLNNTVNSLSVNPFTLSVEKTLSPDETVDATGTTNHFIILPQTIPSGTQIFDIYATVAGETGHFYYTLTSNLDLMAGKVYNFSIKLSDLLEVVTSIQDWTEETDRTGIPTNENTITTSFGIGSWESEN